MPDEVIVKGGERTLVRYGLLPALVPPGFAAERVSDGGDPSGKVEVLRTILFVKRKPAETLVLEREQAFPMSVWTSDYQVYVTADADTRLRLEPRPVWASALVILITVVFLAYATWEAARWLLFGR